jgi:hypothetical protein
MRRVNRAAGMASHVSASIVGLNPSGRLVRIYASLYQMKLWKTQERNHCVSYTQNLGKWVPVMTCDVLMPIRSFIARIYFSYYGLSPLILCDAFITAKHQVVIKIGSTYVPVLSKRNAKEAAEP